MRAQVERIQIGVSRIIFLKEKRVIISFILGAIVIITGLIALLSNFGIQIPLPAVFVAILTNLLTLKILLVLAAIMLFYDSFMVSRGFKKLLFIIAAFVLLLLGLLPFLLDFGLLKFLPFAFDLKINIVVVASVLIAYGVYLIINAFKIIKIYNFYNPKPTH